MSKVLFLLASFLWTVQSLFALPAEVYIISYADPSASYGLSVVGEDRAALLSTYFTQTLPAEGYPIPNVLISAQPSFSTPGPAAILTVAPTSGTLKNPIHTQIANDVATVANFVLTSPICNGKIVLVTWDFSTIPDLIAAFGYMPPDAPVPPCYSRTYILPSFPATSGEQPSVLNQNLHTGDPACGGTPIPNPPTPTPTPSPTPTPPSPSPAPSPPSPGMITQIPGYIPFAIYNNTGLPDSDVYVLAYSGNNNLIEFTNMMGNLLGEVQAPAAIPTGSPEIDYLASNPLYTQQLSTLTPIGSGYYVLYLPKTDFNGGAYNGRMQFSIYQPLPWSIDGTTGVLSPGDGSGLYNTESPGFYVIQDKIEFNMASASTFVINNTWGDFFGLPLAIEVTATGGGPYYSGINPSFARQTIINACVDAVNALPGAATGTWGNLISTYTSPQGSSSDPTFLRVNGASIAAGISPTSVPGVNIPSTLVFPSNYLTNNPYSSCQWLNSVWSNPSNNASYQIHPLSIDMSVTTPGYATGQVDSAGNFKFNVSTGGTVTFPRLTTCAPLYTGNPPSNTVLAGGATQTDAVAIWQIFACTYEVGFHPVIGTTNSNLLQQNAATYGLRMYNDDYYTDSPPSPFGPAPCIGPWYDVIAKALLSFNVPANAPYDMGYYTSPYADVLGNSGVITVTTPASDPVVLINVGSMAGTVQPTPFTDTDMYTVVFGALGAGTTATFNGMNIASSGQTFQNVAGSNMLVALTFTQGSYNGTTFNLTLSPQTRMASPVCAAGTPTMTLSGSTLTVSLPGAPS